MIKRNSMSAPGRTPRHDFVQDPAGELLEHLSSKPGTTLVEKAAALNSTARTALLPILAELDENNLATNEGTMERLAAAIALLDREIPDDIEDLNYGNGSGYTDARHDGASGEA